MPILNRLRIAMCLALAMACKPAPQANTISVLVPLSGELSEQGNAVLKVATLINKKLAGTGVPLFSVSDSNVSSEVLKARLTAETNPYVVLGGCHEAGAMSQAFPAGQGPTAIVLFCDTRDAVAQGVATNVGDALRYFWIGPLEADFARGFRAVMSSADSDFTALPKFGFTLLYTYEEEAEIQDTLQVFTELQWEGQSVNFLPIHESDATHIVDYTETLQTVRQLSDNGTGRNLYSALPWLSQQAWTMQAQAILGDDFARLRPSWYGLFDYQVEDAVSEAKPFDLTGIRSLTVLGNADANSLVDFRNDISAAYNVSGNSMLSRIAADAMSMTSLAYARLAGGGKAPLDYTKQSHAFLDVTGANGGASIPTARSPTALLPPRVRRSITTASLTHSTTLPPMVRPGATNRSRSVMSCRTAHSRQSSPPRSKIHRFAERPSTCRSPSKKAVLRASRRPARVLGWEPTRSTPCSIIFSIPGSPTRWPTRSRLG